MSFMLNPSSSSPPFHYRRTTTAPPPPDHHHLLEGGAPPSVVVDDREDPAIPLSTNTSHITTPISLIEKEHMFDKAVTPSDVGKLNRLVIPKQHAERYFPLDSSTNESKGLLLNFEDRNGKPWRFRYSYWNSSQSYVMTKGWSRFVKEKKLDAGDIVSFERGLGELGKDRLFIDWRRRSPDAPLLHHRQFSSFHGSLLNPCNNPVYLQSQLRLYGGGINDSCSTNYPYGYTGSTAIVNGNPCPPGSVLFLRSGSGNNESGFYGAQRSSEMMQLKGSEHQQQQMVFDSVPVVQGKAAAKRLRLFGVNMDCPIRQESDEECYNNVLSSTAMPMLHDFWGFDSPSSLGPYLHHFNDDGDDENDKGKGTSSMSLDLDI